MLTEREKTIESEPISLARAIATRIWVEQERKGIEVAAYNGEEFPAIIQAERDARISVTTNSIRTMLSDPKSSTTADIYGFPIYENVRKSLSDTNLEDITEEHLDLISTTTTSQFLESIQRFGDATTTGQIQSLPKAAELAREKGVGVATVYLDENLYCELVRRSMTPQAMANLITSAVPLVDVAAMVKEMANVMFKAFNIPEEEAEELYKNMLSDPDFIKDFDDVKLKNKNLTDHIVRLDITRFWGPEVCESLLAENNSEEI